MLGLFAHLVRGRGRGRGRVVLGLGLGCALVHVALEPALGRIQPSDAVRDALHPAEAHLEM